MFFFTLMKASVITSETRNVLSMFVGFSYYIAIVASDVAMLCPFGVASGTLSRISSSWFRDLICTDSYDSDLISW